MFDPTPGSELPPHEETYTTGLKFPLQFGIPFVCLSMATVVGTMMSQEWLALAMLVIVIAGTAISLATNVMAASFVVFILCFIIFVMASGPSVTP
jgi:hypothetical protein